MAWQFDVNNVITSGTPGGDSSGTSLYKLKTLLSATGPGPGWQVRGSGDGSGLFEDIDQGTLGAGTGPGGAYDVLSAHTFWRNDFPAGDWGNQNAWFRVREPGSTREFIFQRDPVWNPGFVAQTEDNLVIVFSPTGFIGTGLGAVSPSVRPTAADEVFILGSPTNNTAQWGNTNTYQSAMRMHVGVNDTAVNGVYAFYMVGMQAGGSTMYQYMLYEPLQETQTGDTQPWAILFGENMNYDGGLQTDDAQFYEPLTTNYVDGVVLPYRTAGGLLMAPRNVPVQADGFERAFPVPVWDNAAQVFKGFLTNYRWKGSSTRNYPDTRDLATANAQVYFGDMLAPWEQGTVPIT